MVDLGSLAFGAPVRVVSAQKLAAAAPPVAHIRRRVMRVSRRRIDFLRQGAGSAYRVPGATQKRLSKAMGVSQSAVSRRMGGLRALGQIVSEAYALEADGISSAFMIAEIEIGASMARLRSLSLDELYAERTRALREEARVIAEADPVHADMLSGDTSAETNRRGRELSRKQSAVSIWLASICAEIEFRQESN